MSLFKYVNTIAIDGPAGSGKSTVSRILAEKLGFTYIDTGAMYRALTLKIMKEDINFSEENKIIKCSAKLNLKLLPSSNQASLIRVMLDGTDVSDQIRRMEVTVNVKHVAVISPVRKNMVKLQRCMAKDINGVVMEGRDIGTAVLPRAKHKFYVDASFEARVQRRLMELRGKGHPVTHNEIADDLKQRDHADKTRKVGPLKKAKDAVFIDTTDLSIEEVVAKMIEIVNRES